MPKKDFGPKTIANRWKAKGLQKLRWWCESCQKQMRDENGFKMHCMSEGHQRQLLLVAENPGKVIFNYSEQFRNSFLDLLRRSYNTRRVHCNVVYNDYIQDKTHLHMNATRWHTLTEFIKYLGREGYCLVDETPKGWYMQWIDRDPVNIARQKRIEKMDAAQRSEEERQAEIIQEQMEKDRQAALERGEILESEYTGLHRDDEAGKIAFKLSLSKKEDEEDEEGQQGQQEEEEEEEDDDDEEQEQNGEGDARGEEHNKRDDATAATAAAAPVEPQPTAAAAAATAAAATAAAATAARPLGKFEDNDDEAGSDEETRPAVDAELRKAFGLDPHRAKKPKEAEPAKRKLSNIELLRIENEEKKKAKRMKEQQHHEKHEKMAEEAHKDYWLHKNIVVKVINRELLGGRYYKRKGVVVEVIDRYTAKVQLLDSSTVLKLDQEFLETVIPAVDGHVLVVNGVHVGCRGRLEALDVDKFSARVLLSDGPRRGDVVSFPYEDICKISDE